MKTINCSWVLANTRRSTSIACELARTVVGSSAGFPNPSDPMWMINIKKNRAGKTKTSIASLKRLSCPGSWSEFGNRKKNATKTTNVNRIPKAIPHLTIGLYRLCDMICNEISSNINPYRESHTYEIKRFTREGKEWAAQQFKTQNERVDYSLNNLNE